jgi:pimeloyl-ACP methyl ester carboxylesterase
MESPKLRILPHRSSFDRSYFDCSVLTCDRYYWRKVLPLLSSKYTVVCPDLRGFGDSTHPAAGYDMRTVAQDISELMTQLGHTQFHLVGEDWGAAAAYQLAANHPDQVLSLTFQEMLLPGFGLEEWSHLTQANVETNRWLWHVNFYNVPDMPEKLITGREKEYFSSFIKNEAYDPVGVSDDAVAEYVRCYSNPGGLRSMLSVYRATLEDGLQNKENAKVKLEMPVLTIGSEHFIAKEVKRQMENVARKVEYVELGYGHQLAEECPDELAEVYKSFIGKLE